MPLTMRPIPHALNLGAPEIYGQGPSGQGAQGTQVLEDVNMASMVGTLAQLGALATVSWKGKGCLLLLVLISFACLLASLLQRGCSATTGPPSVLSTLLCVLLHRQGRLQEHGSRTQQSISF